MVRSSSIRPHRTMWDNLDEVKRLMDIHEAVSGQGPGHRHNVEVLNKSAIVLLVACWESFIEDLAERAFTHILRNAKTPQLFDSKVLAQAAKDLKECKDDREVWKLAGAGWKEVLNGRKERLLDAFHTPRPDRIDKLYQQLLGMRSVSANWRWQGMSAARAKKKLAKLVNLRGEIAHRVKASKAVHKDHVADHEGFINRLGVETSNAVREFVLDKTGKRPWPPFRYVR